MNGWSYATGNPANLTDNSGMYPPIVEKFLSCNSDNPDPICYEYGLLPGPVKGKTPPTPPISPNTPTIGPYVASECSKYYFSAPGYAEGYSNVLSIALAVARITGKEVVYNFATLERATYSFDDAPFIDPDYFPYLSGVTTPELSSSNMSYYVHLQGFDNWLNMDKEYSGAFYGYSAGGGLSVSPIPLSGGGGSIIVFSSELWGGGHYSFSSGGFSLIPLAISFSKTNYQWTSIQSYVPEGMNVEDKHIEQMKIDIQSGLDSPSQLPDQEQRNEAVNRLDEVYNAHRYFFNAHYNEFRNLYGYGKGQ